MPPPNRLPSTRAPILPRPKWPRAALFLSWKSKNLSKQTSTQKFPISKCLVTPSLSVVSLGNSLASSFARSGHHLFHLLDAGVYLLEALGIVPEGPRTLRKNNSGAFVSLAGLAFDINILYQGGITVSWITSTKTHQLYSPGGPGFRYLRTSYPSPGT